MNIINLVKAGQKVWSPVLGDCTITNFSKTENYICITDSHSHRYKLNNEGKFYNNEKLKIVIYPSLYNKNWLTMDTSSVKPGDYLINIFDGSAIILKDFNNEYFNGICDIRNDKVDNKPILVDRYNYRCVTAGEEEVINEILEDNGYIFSSEYMALLGGLWRGKINKDTYLYINDLGQIVATTECNHPSDKKHYEVGNYFRTIDEAMRFQEKVKELRHNLS